MADIYIDESGGFDNDKAAFIIGAQLCFTPDKLDSAIENFENELASKIEYQVFLAEYNQQGIHASSNHPTIQQLFISFLNKCDSRFAFTFTRKKNISDAEKKKIYIKMASGLSRTLIMKVNNNNETANIFYEKSQMYLSGNEKDNNLLKESISQANPSANFMIEGRGKEFKKLGFIDYACNILYRNMEGIINKKTEGKMKFDISQYQFIQQNTSFLRDIDNKKTLIPRKVGGRDRSLDIWLERL